MLLHRLKIPIIFLLTFCSILNLKANNGIDSLETLISSTPISKKKVDDLNELAFLKININNKEALDHANEAFFIAKKINYKKGVADAEVRFGNLSEVDGKYEDAIVFFESALSFRKENATPVGIASIYNNIGLCYSYQSNYEEALLQYEKGLSYLKKRSSRVKGSLLHNQGWASLDKGNYKLAIDYFDKSTRVWTDINDKQTLCSTLLEIGRLYKELNNFSEAKKNYEQGFKIAQKNNFLKEKAIANIYLGGLYYNLEQYATALEYFITSEKLIDHLETYNQAILFKNIGDVFYGQSKYNQALENYNNSLSLYELMDIDEIDWDLAAVYQGVGNVYKALKQFSKAKLNYLKCLDYFGEEHRYFAKVETLFNLSEVCKQLGEGEHAAQLYQQHSELRDSIYLNRIDAINLLHNIEKRKKEKTILIAENLENEKSNQRKNFLIALLFIGGLLISAMFYAYYSRQKMKDAYADIDDLITQQELNMAYAKIEATDDAQKRIGQDLHDKLGVMLATVKLYFNDFSMQLRELKEENKEKQEKAYEVLDEAVKEIRRISHDMKSATLNKFGLLSAVKDLAETIEKTNQLKVSVNSYGLKQRIPVRTEDKIFKIIQELVANVLKHAKSSQLNISLNRLEEGINIIVEDNGIGFDPNQIVEKGGIGIGNIALRVTELKGKYHFDSGKGKGTSVIIDIPLENA